MTAFEGRVALVTGGAGSVGAHLVRSLAEAGATVVLNCFHSYDAAKELAAELGGGVRVIRASVAKQDQVRRMFDEVTSAYGRLDLLVNNAAAGTFVGWDELTEEHLDHAYETNVKGALWCARAARPLLARSDAGCVVNVSSVGAVYAPANYLPVGLSKAALEALTRYLAAEFAPDGIRVNTASAGLLDNPVGRMFPGFDSMSANAVAATPMGRLATPADLADLVLLLASPGAAWVTGQTVVADGGMSLHRAALSPTPAPAPASERVPESASERVPEPAPEPAQSRSEPESASEPEPTSESKPTSEPASDPSPNPKPGHESRTERIQEVDPIAVVGMGLAVPGAGDPDAFWRLLTEGADLFVDVPPDRWPLASFHDDDPGAPDKTYQRRSGFITDFTPHPALAAERPDAGLDHTTLWLRHSVHQALEGVARRGADRFTACFGYTPDGSQHLQEALVDRELGGPGVLPHGDASRSEPFPHRVGAGAIDGLLPADTRLLMVDTACSSSLYAIDLGLRDLLADRAEVAVCGGAFALAPGGSVLFSKLHGLSRGGEVRALDRSADGVLFSDGAGVVVLKRLSRALADGDTVHGLIAGVGLSADGKGKAIYAPSSAGQELAIARAFGKSGVGADDVDWVIAHATGTPAGDEAEFLSLRAAYTGTRQVRVTSNKSLIGHTGWAAGVVSVIHALLGLRHEVIPPQHRFSAAPDAFGLETCNLTIPTRPVPWPSRPDGPRTAAVSGFGFGGTNAHLLVQEFRPGLPAQAGYGARNGEPMVIVGWSAHVPGAEDNEQVGAWARGRHLQPDSFGDRYPHPPFARLRLPASTIRATDRTQLMIIECMQRLEPRVREFCARHSRTTGVVVGHTGPTRNAVLYAVRAHLDELGHLAGERAVELRERVTGLIGPPDEDSFPGEMPNVIAARLSGYFDLRGLNIAVDGGAASLADAFDLAGRYLDFGDVDVVLVAGSNGNSLRSWGDLLGCGPIGEGTFLFAVTRESLALAEGLPVLAEVSVEAVAEERLEATA
ncbi:SDR family oxidoreductase [Streptosporangium sp. V21-05]|uniref:SDR family oxidoreductase n=1 Tax=Streptosporangium sp. V21-05 TaxID=3446115 RepID=UPI003F538186